MVSKVNENALEKKKRRMWTEAENRETGQNAALASVESQQFAAP